MTRSCWGLRKHKELRGLKELRWLKELRGLKELKKLKSKIPRVRSTNPEG
jgi:hypothetical protein